MLDLSLSEDNDGYSLQTDWLQQQRGKRERLHGDRTFSSRIQKDQQRHPAAIFLMHLCDENKKKHVSMINSALVGAEKKTEVRIPATPLRALLAAGGFSVDFGAGVLFDRRTSSRMSLTSTPFICLHMTEVLRLLYRSLLWVMFFNFRNQKVILYLHNNLYINRYIY